jgi:DnaK suppressor protein
VEIGALADNDVMDPDAREALSAEQAEVAVRVAALSRSLEDIVAASLSSNADDEHDPEGSTIAFERAQVTALLAQARTHLAEATEALQRLDAGRYGRCERCEGPIAAERLLAGPTARTCIHCASDA